MTVPARRPAHEATSPNVTELREYLIHSLELLGDLTRRLEELTAETRLRIYTLGVAEDPVVAARIDQAIEDSRAGMVEAIPADEFIDRLRQKADLAGR